MQRMETIKAMLFRFREAGDTPKQKERKDSYEEKLE